MPVLQNNVTVERFYLPSTEHLANDDPDKAYVDMNVGKLLAADLLDAAKDETLVSMSIKMLVARIKDWSYTDVSGQKLPIKFDTVKQLDVDDYQYLVAKIPNGNAELTADQKKT